MRTFVILDDRQDLTTITKSAAGAPVAPEGGERDAGEIASQDDLPAAQHAALTIYTLLLLQLCQRFRAPSA